MPTTYSRHTTHARATHNRIEIRRWFFSRCFRFRPIRLWIRGNINTFMAKSNPFEHAPKLPDTGSNTVDPATHATGSAPMPDKGEGVDPSVSTGTEGWGLGKGEPNTSGQKGRKNKIDEDAA
jgi:hypothetical protein